jgi:uncharacterized membrane protein YhaH (DUF805 family)
MTVNSLSMMARVLPAVWRADTADMAEQLFGGVHDHLTALAGIALFMVAMLAAAVTRRLHDAGRSGAYGLLPLPFLALGFFLFGVLTSGMLMGEDVRGDHGTVFALGFANNLVYLGTLAFLVFLLVKPSDASENRFGPPPGPLGGQSE